LWIIFIFVREPVTFMIPARAFVIWRSNASPDALTIPSMPFPTLRATAPDALIVAARALVNVFVFVNEPETLTVAASAFATARATVPEMLTVAARAFVIARPTVPDRLTVPTSDLLTTRATDPEALMTAERVFETVVASSPLLPYLVVPYLFAP